MLLLNRRHPTSLWLSRGLSRESGSRGPLDPDSEAGRPGGRGWGRAGRSSGWSRVQRSSSQLQALPALISISEGKTRPTSSPPVSSSSTLSSSPDKHNPTEKVPVENSKVQKGHPILHSAEGDGMREGERGGLERGRGSRYKRSQTWVMSLWC